MQLKYTQIRIKSIMVLKMKEEIPAFWIREKSGEWRPDLQFQQTSSITSKEASQHSGGRSSGGRRSGGRSSGGRSSGGGSNGRG